MELQPVERRSAAGAAFEQLFRSVLAGAPGTALPAERALTEQLKVNRQAVREALQRLAQAGLVQIQQGGATRVLDYRTSGSLDLLPSLFVRPDGSVDPAVARSVMEMRACIGPDVARLCALRAIGTTGERIDEVVDRMAKASDDRERAELDLGFWDLLVDGSDNIAYRLAFNSLRRAYEPLIEWLSPVLADELSDVEARRRIAAAVAAQDPGGAEAAARDLLRKGTSTVTGLLMSGEEGDG